MPSLLEVATHRAKSKAQPKKQEEESEDFDPLAMALEQFAEAKTPAERKEAFQAVLEIRDINK